MKNFKGKSVFEGYAICEVRVYTGSTTTNTTSSTFKGVDEEFARFDCARKQTIKNLEELFIDTVNSLGQKEAQLFETHRLMAEDLDFEDLVRSNIANNKVAEDAIKDASSELATMFSSLDDEYMKGRAADVLEVGEMMRDILLGRNQLPTLENPTILLCDDLPANFLMKLPRNKLKGLVMIKGNVNSHVSIFARTLELPTVVDLKELKLDKNLDKTFAILDANSGNIIFSPNEEEIKKYTDLADKYNKDISSLKSLIGQPSITKDGFKVKLFANIASAYEVANVIKKDAEGVGLFRSEFIYLQSKDYPSEEMQFNYYREVIEEMRGKEVIIRTFDIGADKKVFYFNLPYEENPALGYRSIRICKDRPEMFLTQLRALYRASAYGNLSIMIPMIISVEEVKFALKMCKQAQDELTKEGIKFNPKVKIGIMIETPSAAIMSDQLARYVDFFSIGTNDLSQYTLACDRLNANIASTFDPHHPSILRLIKLTVENAHKNNIVCGMCGELARDPYMLPFLMGIHIDELSCSAAYVLKVRKEIKDIDTSKVDIDKYIN